MALQALPRNRRGHPAAAVQQLPIEVHLQRRTGSPDIGRQQAAARTAQGGIDMEAVPHRAFICRLGSGPVVRQCHHLAGSPLRQQRCVAGHSPGITEQNRGTAGIFGSRLAETHRLAVEHHHAPAYQPGQDQPQAQQHPLTRAAAGHHRAMFARPAHSPSQAPDQLTPPSFTHRATDCISLYPVPRLQRDFETFSGIASPSWPREATI